MELKESVKEKIRDHLKKMNEALAEARKALEAGDCTKALEKIQAAADEKHLAISDLPDVPLTQKISIPFFPIYDVFTEIDRLVKMAYFAVVVAKGALKVDAVHKPGDYIPSLSELIDELMANLITKYKDLPSEALDIINKLLDALVKIRKTIRDGDFSKVEPLGDDLFWQPHDVKIEFLKFVGKDIGLDDIYARFVALDDLLLGLVGGMTATRDAGKSDAPLAKSDTEAWIKAIGNIESRKKELEGKFAKSE